MLLAFENARAVLFGDPNIGVAVICTADDGGAPVLVCAAIRRPDEVTSFGAALPWSETTRVDLRVAVDHRCGGRGTEGPASRAARRSFPGKCCPNT